MEQSKDKYYLRIDNNKFGFITKEIHEIKDTDIEITYEDYNKFFELQSQGKQFRLKEISTGNMLFDYIEEFIPEIVQQPPTETAILKEKVDILEQENADLLLDSVNKDIRIEKNEADIADLLIIVNSI